MVDPSFDAEYPIYQEPGNMIFKMVIFDNLMTSYLKIFKIFGRSPKNY